MIDTDKIKKRWNNFEFGLVVEIDKATMIELYHDLKTLMQSHDKIERKLELAEGAIEVLQKRLGYPSDWFAKAYALLTYKDK